MDISKIIDKYYNENAALRRILVEHSKAVAEKALEIAKHSSLFTFHSSLSTLHSSLTFVYDAAMLHDIGIIKCDAPGIECFGTEHYIRHGLCGAAMLRENAAEWGMTPEQVEPYARVCERHTGAGLTAEEIRRQNLPLPAVDMLPETIEEKLICYADKFFSKTRPTEEKTFERVLRSMEKFGPDTVARFMELHQLFNS